jgi:predicted TIM-barrel fold metal-dependent hydrolase
LRRNLSSRLLFGTDWPIHRLFGRQKSWVDAVDDFVARKLITSADADNFFYKNIMTLLPQLAQQAQPLRGVDPPSKGKVRNEHHGK